MSDEAIKESKNAADRLILAEVHSRLDWLDTTSPVAVKSVIKMAEDGLIEGFRFRQIEIKVNGTWYKRP